MTLVAEIGDLDRFPTARMLCAWAGLPRPCATPTVRSATATSPSRARCGCGILQEAAQTAKQSPMLPAPTPSWPAAAARTSPPWPSPAGGWGAISEPLSGPSRPMILGRSSPTARSFIQPGAPPCPRLRPGLHRRHRSQPTHSPPGGRIPHALDKARPHGCGNAGRHGGGPLITRTEEARVQIPSPPPHSSERRRCIIGGAHLVLGPPWGREASRRNSITTPGSAWAPAT
jgi:hypothetical protein